MAEFQRKWTKDSVWEAIEHEVERALAKGEIPRSRNLPAGSRNYTKAYFGSWGKILRHFGIERSEACKRKPKKKSDYKQSLCWTCKNAYAHRCGWFSAGIKPKGAIFESRKVAENGRHKGWNMYACVSCPNFECDGGKPNTKLDDEGVERLIYAIVASAAKEIRKYPTKSDSAKSFFKSDWFEELTGIDGRRALREVMKID